MRQFKIVTSCTAITEYIVTADTAEAAQEQYENGNYDSHKITDYHDEEVVSTEEVA